MNKERPSCFETFPVLSRLDPTRFAGPTARLSCFRAGFCSGLAARAGFTPPSALALIPFAYGFGQIGDMPRAAWLHGLKIITAVALAVPAFSLLAAWQVRPCAAGSGRPCLIRPKFSVPP